MRADFKQRLSTILSIFSRVFQFGFIPLIMYLGFRNGADPGMPELSWRSLFINELPLEYQQQ